jgi:multidrug resistance protein, MATE family
MGPFAENGLNLYAVAMKADAIPSRKTESAALLKIAGPLIVSYVADSLSFIIAKSVVGKLGFVQLGAVGVSADMAFQIAIVVMGFFSVVGVLVAEALGRRRREDIVIALMQGLMLAIMIGGLLFLYVRNLDAALGLARQSPEVIELARPFYESFAFAMVPFVLFAVLRGFAAAMGRTGMIMLVTIVSVAVQYVAMNGLVHGRFGMPSLGVAGAGLGWSIVMWLRFVLLACFVAWIIWREALPFPDRQARRNILRLGHFLHLGIPVAGIVALESGLFGATSLMSGWLGPVPLAAYQMMMSWISIPFLISLALADAAMVRVSYWMGAGSRPAARQAGHLGMIIGVMAPLLLVVLPLAAPQVISRLFLDPSDPGYAEISALVAGLLAIGALFQVFDGLQAIASHALRGLRDARVPLIIAGTGYWAIGLVASYLFAFPFGWGAYGLWWGVALGLGFTASLLAWRFERLSRQR